MAKQGERARVFISCGQADGEERDTAVKIARMLEHEYGFEPYVAGEQVSFSGVKEAIFRQLPESEYFLFIDFPRDELPDGFCRGSLFSNQELAIAAYLDLDFLGFRHRSVRPFDGLLKFVQADIPVFDNVAQLPQLVRDAVQSKWHADWKNGLQLRRDPDEFDHITRLRRDVYGNVTMNREARFFHLDVFNSHLRKTALDCVTYVESIRDVKQGCHIPFRRAEIKWAGSVLPMVPIPPRTHRMIDICMIYPDELDNVYFMSYSDSHQYMGIITGVYELDVEFCVYSANMQQSSAAVRISLGSTIDKTRVLPV